MKVETKKAVVAYKELKELKVNGISDETMVKVWNNIRKLRPISETYEKDVEDVKNSLMDDNFKAMQARLVKAQEREQKARNGEYVLTDEDLKDVQEINLWLSEQDNKTKSYIQKIDETMVEVKVDLIDSAELLKAFKNSDKTFDSIIDLEFLTK